eukprot:GHVT01095307.1.p1 GENE.GHVT01095307.1~~GHVT01095307.1.p1  ORF type:complete len:1472 (-),score=182.88 GHVT01095307.1:1015-5367(-)
MAGIIDFMPYSFDCVNTLANQYYRCERQRVYCTPKSFLELLKLYRYMLDRKNTEISAKRNRLIDGLEKLRETQVKVSALEESLKDKQVVVQQKKQEADQVAEEVGVEKAKVALESEKARVEAEKCGEIQARVSVQQESCEQDLAMAIPLVEQAEAALNTLNKKDFQEAKSLNKPPPGVDDITTAVMHLLATIDPSVEVDKQGRIKDRSWKAALKMMNSPEKLLSTLKEFKGLIDGGKVPEQNFKQVDPLLNLPHFNRETIQKKSNAAAGLAEWVINIHLYYKVTTTVEPKKQALREATAQLEAANTKLAKVQQLVDELNQKLSALVSAYDAALAEKNAVVAEAERCERKMNLAQRLLTALSSENVLIENMDEHIEAVILPIISRATIRHGRSTYIHVGDKDVLYHPNFKLFLHTKMSHPHYPPEIQAECTIINFTVTEKGLEDQLLAFTVKKERPDLSKQKLLLIQQQNEFKIQLADLESSLLEKLTTAQGDILEDTELIENLEKTKKISVEVANKVATAKETETKINDASERFRQTAARGSLLFFLLSELVKMHTFYAYSLESFLVVINRAFESVKFQPNQRAHRTADEVTEIIEQNDTEARPRSSTGSKRSTTERSVSGSTDQEPSIQPEAGGGPGAPEEAAQTADGRNDDDRTIEETPAAQLSPEELQQRVGVLTDVVTRYVFDYVNRGLFEKHKLIVAVMLTLRILVRHGQIDEQAVNVLISCSADSGSASSQMSEGLSSWMTEASWSACKVLEQLSTFKSGSSSLTQNLEQDAVGWKRWLAEKKPETLDPPRAYRGLTSFQRLLLIRALRPDRLTAALREFVGSELGPSFVDSQPFDMSQLYHESDQYTPIFFVLFPGVDPTEAVEEVAKKQGCTQSNGKFVNISMGQGQEKIAIQALELAARDGGWVMLQNVHLMQSWLKTLERNLELVAENSHENFRCIISSEAPPQPDMKIIPESILQKCIKVADEAPQDLKANLRRAFAKFKEMNVDSCAKPKELKGLVFALCLFHSLILGRKKFGTIGWSRPYSFNDGDLTICGDVLRNYLERYPTVPYEDLRYIFGEIMYGGHITDEWDRRTNSSYLSLLITPGASAGGTLAPGLKAPDANKFDMHQYSKLIEEKLPQETPQMFGLHPNAELGFLTAQGEELFVIIQDISGTGVSGAGAASGEDPLGEALVDLLRRIPANIDVPAARTKIKTLTPYIVVGLQEADRMTLLLTSIRSSLEELQLGLAGALNMTDAMDSLAASILLNRVPSSWDNVAYPSKKPLQGWITDLRERAKQLETWVGSLEVPIPLWISGLFNPMAFLTAVMQVTSRLKGWPLDDMTLRWTVTSYTSVADVPGFGPEEGAFISGLFLQGAGWEIGKTGESGHITESRAKELHTPMPIIHVSAVRRGESSTDSYACPVYVTSQRGPTYVCTALLSTEVDDDPSRWILSGVALLMADD